MTIAVVIAIISGMVSLAVGVITPLITINLNRATAVKLLTEAAEKTGMENKRLNEKLVDARKSILCLANAIDKVIPLLSTNDTHRQELRDLADEARVNL